VEFFSSPFSNFCFLISTSRGPIRAERSASDRELEEQFGGNVEAAAEAFDVAFVQFALAAENFGDDAGGAENIGEVFLQEAMLVHEELEDFERLGAGKLVEKNALHRGHREHRGHRAARNDRTRMLARRPGLRAARAKSADAGEGDVVVAGGGRRAGEQRQERFLTFVRNDGWE
jgi:hypothetical protein